jgi:type I restriction enzyme S subunit
MNFDLVTYELGELGSLKNGANFNKNDAGDGCPVMSVKQLFRGRFVDTEGLGSIKLGTLKKLDDYLVKKNDLLFARSSLKAEGSGQVAIVNEYPQNCIFSGFTIRFRLFDESKVNPLYLYYLLRSPKYREIFVRITTGSVISNLTQATLSKIPVELPNKETQDYVANILDELDRKRELGGATNQTLEQLAQAIFKSWFVDFDPVKAKMNGEQPDGMDAATASLFPEKLVESELGLIPEGWELTNIGKVSECSDKKRIPLSKRQREQKQGSIPYYGATSVMDYVDEAIFDDIYLLIGEDGSVMKDDGTPFIQYIWGPAWVNNHAHVLQGIKSISTEQLMLFFQQTNINAYVTGAVQLKINQRNMNSIPFIKAPKEINERFYDVVAPLYAKIRAIKEENEQLAKLRDTLLPKLLSGEIELETK